jgi:hypothetical protein
VYVLKQDIVIIISFWPGSGIVYIAPKSLLWIAIVTITLRKAALAVSVGLSDDDPHAEQRTSLTDPY